MTKRAHTNNESTARVWSIGRTILCILAFVSGFVMNDPEAMELHPPLSFAVVDAALVVLSPLLAYFGLWFVLGFQSRNPRSAEYWSMPTWRSNWLDFRDPAHFFHLAAFIGIAFGAGLLSGFLMGHHGKLMDGIACIGAGSGLLVCLRRCPKLFPHKYRPG